MARILLVEDDLDFGPLLEAVLRSAGYRVEVAPTFSDALARLDEHAFDLVLTDGRLPDGTGLDLADRASSLGISALILTGYALQYPAERLARHRYLLKPVHAAELLDEVRACLAGTDPASAE